MKSTLQARLLYGIGTATTVVLTVCMLLLYGSIRRTMMSEFDELLASRTRSLVTLVEQHGDTIELGFHTHPMPEFARNLRPEYYQVRDETGAVLARSRRLEGDLPVPAGSRAAPRFESLTLPDGRPGRAVGIQFLPRVDGETLDHPLDDSDDDVQHENEDKDDVDFSSRRAVVLVVARETRSIDDSVATVALLLVSTGVGTLLGLFGVLAWIVQRNLAPLRSLASRIEDVDERSLNQRVDLANAPREIEVVTGRLNDLIARLETAFLRERTFTADMAHELRTPLAGIRATLEVALRRERTADSYRKSLRQCLTICSDTQQVVGTLLSLARIEAGQESPDAELVDLELILRNCWTQFETRAAERNLITTWDCPGDVLLSTDAQQFRVVLYNVFRNAVEYSNEGGTISVQSSIGTAHLNIGVRNSIRDSSNIDVARVFDRFWRADSARTDTGSHAGLGLALCNKIMGILGGTIGASATNGFFTATISIPIQSVECGLPDREHDEQWSRQRSVKSADRSGDSAASIVRTGSPA